MKLLRTLLPLSIAFSLIYLASGPGVSDRMGGFKVGSILLLAFAGFHVDKLLGTALTICSLGDFLLGVRRLGSLDAAKLFLFGLGAFLVAHLVYIAMFRRYRLPGWKPHPLRILGIGAIVMALGAVLVTLQHSLGPLFIPVVAYAMVLAGMATSAMMADLGNPLAAVGSLFFVASDAMLAISKFRTPFPGYGPLIWITYYLAQVLIFLGVEGRHRREACPSADTASKIERL
jgi:uncharacterized membrane protein YhhN